MYPTGPLSLMPSNSFLQQDTVSAMLHMQANLHHGAADAGCTISSTASGYKLPVKNLRIYLRILMPVQVEYC